MLYVAGEIFLWMALAFVLGVAVGWFVWGIRRTKSAPAASAASATATSEDVESVTVRPVARPAEPDQLEVFPETPPAGVPVVPLAPPVSMPPAEPPQGAEPPPGAEPAPHAELAALVSEVEDADDDAGSVADDLVFAHDDVGASRPGASLAAGSAALGRHLAVDDLQVVEGIGPGVEGILKEAGIVTWSDLAEASPDRLRTLLDLAGDQYRVHDPTSWPEQAGLACEGRWDDLVALQAGLAGGRSG
jgi:predicted flap endonuclease-1-like 5' DNA nuclease